MALALRLFLLLLLLLAVALHARAAQAAPVPARGADRENDLDYLEDEVLKFFWPPGAEPVGDGDQEPAVGPRAEPLEGRVDPLTDEEQPPGEKKSQEAVELLDKMLSELERQRDESTGDTSPAPSTENSLEPSGIPADMDQEMALWKAAAPEGGTDSSTASPKRKAAMPGTDKPDVVGKAGTENKNPQSVRRVVCPPDYRRRCMIGMLVTLSVVPMILLCCGFMVRKFYKSRKALTKLMMA